MRCKGQRTNKQEYGMVDELEAYLLGDAKLNKDRTELKLTEAVLTKEEVLAVAHAYLAAAALMKTKNS